MLSQVVVKGFVVPTLISGLHESDELFRAENQKYFVFELAEQFDFQSQRCFIVTNGPGGNDVSWTKGQDHIIVSRFTCSS